MSRWAIYAVCLAATAALVACAFAVVRVGNAAESAIAEARETMHQARLALGSVRGLTFDLRKNWTANEEVNKKTLQTIIRMADCTEKAVNTLTQEFALTMDYTRSILIPATEEALKEFKTAVADVRTCVKALSQETGQTIAEVRPVLQATEKTITGIGNETQAILQRVQSIEDNLGDLSKNIAVMSGRLDNVVAKYEKTILHPSWKQRLKGIFQLVLSGFNLWADVRLIF